MGFLDGVFQRFIAPVEKAKYWSHADGTLWWRNPDTDQIEPYSHEEHTGETEEDQVKPKHLDASGLVDIPQKPLFSAIFTAKTIVQQVKGGMSTDKAMSLAVKNAESNTRNMIDPEYLSNCHKALSELGLKEVASVYQDRLSILEGGVPEPEVFTPPKDFDSVATSPNGNKYFIRRLPDALGGSTGAYRAEALNEDGSIDQIVIKEYNGNENQVRNEWLANKIYRSYGNAIKTPPSLMLNKDGKKVLANAFLPEIDTLGDYEAPSTGVKESVRKGVQAGFIMGAWLANWDVVGLEEDNIAVDRTNSSVYALDNGGALLYRAQGEPKGAAFGSEVTEVNTMRDPSISPTAAKYFGDISDTEIIDQIDALERQYNFNNGIQGLHEMVAQAGFSEKVTSGLAVRLTERFDSLKKYKEGLQKKVDKDLSKLSAKKKAPVGSTKVFSNTQIVDMIDWFADNGKDLSQEGVEAINAYTYEPGGGTGMHYQFINNRVANKDTEDIKEHLAVLDSTLDSLPSYDGLCFRGIREYPNSKEHFEKWATGEWSKVEWNSYTSTSLAVSSSANTYPDEGMSFVIKSRGVNGRFIAPLSNNNHEYEVLFKRDSKYRVVAVCDQNITVGMTDMGRTVVLEELTDEEFSKYPDSQKAPKKLSGLQMSTFIKTNQPETNTDELLANVNDVHSSLSEMFNIE